MNMDIINQASPLMVLATAALLLIVMIVVVATKAGATPRFEWPDDGFVAVLGYRFNCTEEPDVFFVDVADASNSEDFRNIVKAPSKHEAENEVRRWLTMRIAESARTPPVSPFHDDQAATATR